MRESVWKTYFGKSSCYSSAVKWQGMNENNQKTKGLLPSLGKYKTSGPDILKFKDKFKTFLYHLDKECLEQSRDCYLAIEQRILGTNAGKQLS